MKILTQTHKKRQKQQQQKNIPWVFFFSFHRVAKLNTSSRLFVTICCLPPRGWTCWLFPLPFIPFKGNMWLFQKTHIHFIITQFDQQPCSVHGTTDFKFIGKVESQTNIFLKSSVLAHFTWTFFKKPICSLIYMPNHSGKNLEPNSWFRLVFGLMTPTKEGVFTSIGKNFAETLQFENLAVRNFFLFYYMHIFV